MIQDRGTCFGELAIGGDSTHTWAWAPLNVTMLWFDVPYRGGTKVLPTVAGSLSYPLRRAEATHSVPFVIIGDHDAAGAELPDPYEGLQANVAELQTSQWLQPIDTGDGTQAATLTMPDGTVRTADVQVLGLVPGRPFTGTGPDGIYGVGVLATLELRIPSGRFM